MRFALIAVYGDYEGEHVGVYGKTPLVMVFVYRLDGGDEGIRTLDLSDANRTLSQLSYAPTRC